MPGSKKKNAKPPSQKRPRSHNIRNLPEILRDKFSRFLSWLSSLFGEDNVVKALVKQILGVASKWVARMKPVHFVCLLVVLVVATMLIALFIPPPDNLDKPSPPITVLLSEMGAGTDPNGYISDDAGKAIDEIRRGLGAFDARLRESDEPDPGDDRIVVNVVVGCYQAEEPNSTKPHVLRIRIPELKGDDLSPRPYAELYKLPLGQIAGDIRKCILRKYPPTGYISYLQPKEEVPPARKKSQDRVAHLNIGSLAGVREKDVFQVVPSNVGRLFHRSIEIKIWEVSPMDSKVLVRWDQEIEKGWGVKWKGAGY